MKKSVISLLSILLAILLAACAPTQTQTANPTPGTPSQPAVPTSPAAPSNPTVPSNPSVPPTTPTKPTAPPTTPPTVPPTAPPTVPTQPPVNLHSPLYIEGVSVEDVIRYFNEVCLDAEFSSGGNASLVQKWTQPIYYRIEGNPTNDDLVVLNGFVQWLNTIEGFPGMSVTEQLWQANLSLNFLDYQAYMKLMGNNFSGTDGGVTYWYRDNEIYNGTIGYRTDIGQYIRNSVILEEIYNGLGPVQDTALRADSIIFSGFSTPQSLTAVDELILKLLYHPDIKCGMNAAACEAVIRQLYY